MAKAIELEGEKLLKGNDQGGTSDIRPEAKSERKGAISMKDSSNGLEPGSDNEEENERGGFSQPVALARFIKDAKAADPLVQTELHAQRFKDTLINSGNDINAENSVEPYDNRPKQICRVWLKNAYLGIGKPCKGGCNRKHEIPSKQPESMYSDFAFKGLQVSHQQKILSMAKAGISPGNGGESSLEPSGGTADAINGNNKKRKATSTSGTQEEREDCSGSTESTGSKRVRIVDESSGEYNDSGGIKKEADRDTHKHKHKHKKNKH